MGEVMNRWILIFFLSFNLSAQEKEKTYTEEEFKKALRVEVKKELENLDSKKLVKYFKGLLEKEDMIDKKQLDLAQKERKLKMSIEQFEKRIKLLSGQQDKILGCLDDIKKGESDRVSNMVEIISNMKADKAAEVLSVQDPDITIKILRGLDPLKVSKLFNQMDKEISARLQKQFLTMKK